MRKVFVIFVLLICLSPVADTFGQRSKVMNLPKYDYADYHFGFTLGLNQMLFTVKPVTDLNTRVFTQLQNPDINVDSSMLLGVNSSPTFGFIIGIVGDKHLGPHVNVRLVPALVFGERYINYSILGYRGESATLIDVEKNIGSVFIDVPVMFKYKSKRLNNMLAFITAGGQYSYDIASNAKRRDQTEQIVIRLKQHDFYAVVGVGFDFYNPWFKLGVELKMAYGLFDMLVRDNTIYTQGIEKLNSKIFQLGVTFE